MVELVKSNFGIRDEIAAYWSARAATFDEQPGHEIFSEPERRAWHALIHRHLGDGAGRTALDLATGTGVIAHLLDDLGFRVTGLDWSEAMLDRAKAKAAARGRPIRFLHGDAEATMLPDAACEVIVTRHLVWTLVDPPAAFREWRRVLTPGGTLLIVDGDFVTPTVVARLATLLVRLKGALLRRPAAGAVKAEMQRTHQDILSRLPFAHGARAGEIAALLKDAGFGDIVIDEDLGAIHRAQARHMHLSKGLERMLQHRYAIRASAPLGPR
ncbi:class I SAM-dependent methyltransferase [Acuticoccus kandeliae]|uniref:class I SAM-dependent methyltransferase n=1 Tax=Acuticoccus kandeliae TaxID=2073160 RepID=UPI000D3E5E81|nr:class I SAM-dependent methyltransferase [Acuticoccus kandeliae]